MPFYLNQDSKNQAAALDFLRFLSSVEGNQIFANVSQWLPAIQGVRPTRFSEQFKPFYEGYLWDNEGSVFFHGIGPEMGATFLTEMNQLFGPGGSVGAFQDALDRALPEAEGRDVRAYLRNSLNAFNDQDAGYAAGHQLGAPGRRLLAPAGLLEAHYYQIRGLLARASSRLVR